MRWELHSDGYALQDVGMISPHNVCERVGLVNGWLRAGALDSSRSLGMTYKLVGIMERSREVKDE